MSRSPQQGGHGCSGDGSRGWRSVSSSAGLGGSHLRARFKHRGHPCLAVFPGITSDNVDKPVLELRGSRVTDPGLGRTTVTGRPAFWRASMNDVNASPVPPLPEYLSSCSSGNSSRGCSLSSSRRLQKSSSTRSSSTRRVLTLLNDLRSLCHSVRSTSLCSSDDRIWTSCWRVRSSTLENI
jgi:hypothetical protein